MSNIVGRVINYFQPCKWLAPLRRRAAPEFSRGFQPTEWLENVPASRERRLNSIVADATWESTHAYRGLKPTAKFRRRSAADKKVRPATRAVSVSVENNGFNYTFPAHSLTILRLRLK
jgi:hypothetical protein